jgi:hypothetical protein
MEGEYLLDDHLQGFVVAMSRRRSSTTKANPMSAQPEKGFRT